MNERKAIESAVERVESYADTEFDRAVIEVLNSALSFMDDVEYENPKYSNGKSIPPERVLKVTPWGRAVVRLAESIIGESK